MGGMIVEVINERKKVEAGDNEGDRVHPSQNVQTLFVLDIA